MSISYVALEEFEEDQALCKAKVVGHLIMPLADQYFETIADSRRYCQPRLVSTVSILEYNRSIESWRGRTVAP